jgi:hypothetical protein
MQGIPSSWLSGLQGDDLAAVERALIHVEHHSEQVEQTLLGAPLVQVRRAATRSFSIVLPNTPIRMSHTDTSEAILDGTSGELVAVEYSATFDQMCDLPVVVSYTIDSDDGIAGAIHVGDEESAIIGGSGEDLCSPSMAIEWQLAPQAPSNDGCVPDCGTRTCGLEVVCGTSCGECASTGEVCSPDGHCVAACVPDCSNRVCGDDGCGGSCGTCQSTPGEPVDCIDGQCVAA